MMIQRTVELGAGVDEVWRFLQDGEQLVDWIGDQLRGVEVIGDEATRSLRWSWTVDGIESAVEVTVVGDGERTEVVVVEQVTGAAPACALARWDGALLDLELRAMTWQQRLARTSS